MISFLVAFDRNRLIGRENELPWHLPADLEYFKQTTLGKTIVMGRKTYESIGKPLPGRTNVVLTKNTSFKAEGCTILHAPVQVLQISKPDEEVFVIGGNTVFKAFEPYVERLYITEINASFEGDTYFSMDYKKWTVVASTEGIQDEQNPYKHTFLVLERQPFSYDRK